MDPVALTARLCVLEYQIASFWDIKPDKKTGEGNPHACFCFLGCDGDHLPLNAQRKHRSLVFAAAIWFWLSAHAADFSIGTGRITGGFFISTTGSEGEHSRDARGQQKTAKDFHGAVFLGLRSEFVKYFNQTISQSFGCGHETHTDSARNETIYGIIFQPSVVSSDHEKGTCYLVGGAHISSGSSPELFEEPSPPSRSRDAYGCHRSDRH